MHILAVTVLPICIKFAMFFFSPGAITINQLRSLPLETLRVYHNLLVKVTLLKFQGNVVICLLERMEVLSSNLINQKLMLLVCWGEKCRFFEKILMEKCRKGIILMYDKSVIFNQPGTYFLEVKYFSHHSATMLYFRIYRKQPCISRTPDFEAQKIIWKKRKTTQSEVSVKLYCYKQPRTNNQGFETLT